MTDRVRCAIVGCGVVSEQYATTLTASPDVDLVACADLDTGRAARLAERHGIPLVAPLDRLLAEADLDLVAVLVPPEAHLPVARQVVAAGVAVYVEKPLGLDPAEAAAFLDGAEAAGVPVGAAPDTFLAGPAQAAAAALAAGAIGEPVGATALMLSTGPEGWHPAPDLFYAPRSGPLYDMGPYYLTMLSHLLGPIAEVAGATAVIRPVRYTAAGRTFHAQAPTHVSALLRTATGVPVTFAASFDVAATGCPHLEVYGSEGTLVLPDPNFHTGSVRIRAAADDDWRALPLPPGRYDGLARGIGVLDTAAALRGGEPHHSPQATGRRALHVLETMAAIERSALAGHAVPVGSAELADHVAGD